MSQFTREDSPARTLADFIPVKDVYAVGRLDRDSEGLLLLTDDGALQHRLSDPKFEHRRTYWTQVEGAITKAAMDSLRGGIDLDGRRTRTAEVCTIPEPAVPARDPPVRYRKAIPTCWLELTIREGRNRQVRRMTAFVGFPTLRLIRIAIGDLRLDGLEPGKYRELSPDELRRLHTGLQRR